MFMDDFIYSKDIEEIKPMVLNLTLGKVVDHKVQGELRKKFTIDLDNKETWIELFSKSLEGKPIKANIIIAFRNKFNSACHLKQINLLKPGTKIKID
jgi:hypothetical protein